MAGRHQLAAQLELPKNRVLAPLTLLSNRNFPSCLQQDVDPHGGPDRAPWLCGNRWKQCPSTCMYEVPFRKHAVMQARSHA